MAHTFLDMNLDGQSGYIEGNSAQNRVSVQSLINLPLDTEIDGTVRYVGELLNLNIPSYVTLGLRWGWRPWDDLENFNLRSQSDQQSASGIHTQPPSFHSRTRGTQCVRRCEMGFLMDWAISRHGFLQRLGVLFCLLLLYSVWYPKHAADAPTTAEEQSLKAVMNSIILRSTQWPDHAFEAKSSRFRIGIIGKKVPLDEFQEAFDGVNISGRTVTIVRLKEPDDGSGLHAIYFVNASKDVMTTSLAAAAGKPAISLGDHDDSITFGGTSNYRKVTDKLRFEFNRKSMEQSGVKVSAQMIRLALPTRNEGKK